MSRKPVAASKSASARGEASVTVGDRTYKLKMTLGAMAEIEDAFACDFVDIEQHLTSTKRIAQFVVALARAAGEDVGDADVEAIRRSNVDIRELLTDVISTGATPAAPETAAKNGAAPSQ